MQLPLLAKFSIICRGSKNSPTINRYDAKNDKKVTLQNGGIIVQVICYGRHVMKILSIVCNTFSVQSLCLLLDKFG
jgi:hypothetical protein